MLWPTMTYCDETCAKEAPKKTSLNVTVHGCAVASFSLLCAPFVYQCPPSGQNQREEPVLQF